MEVIVKHATPIHKSEFKPGDLVISQETPQKILIVGYSDQHKDSMTFAGMVLQDLNVVPHVVGFFSSFWKKHDYQQFFGAITLKTSEL